MNVNALVRLFVLVLAGALIWWLVGFLPIGAFFKEILGVIGILICIVFVIDGFYPFITRRNGG